MLKVFSFSHPTNGWFSLLFYFFWVYIRWNLINSLGKSQLYTQDDTVDRLEATSVFYLQPQLSCRPSLWNTTVWTLSKSLRAEGRKEAIVPIHWVHLNFSFQLGCRSSCCVRNCVFLLCSRLRHQKSAFSKAAVLTTKSEVLLKSKR